MNSALRYTQEIPQQEWEEMSKRVKSLNPCECHYEPRGDDGLEGYSAGCQYQFEVIYPGFETPYYRVWPDAECCPEYYECCSPRAFRKYFTPIL
jgi:hypothetical protein